MKVVLVLLVLSILDAEGKFLDQTDPTVMEIDGLGYLKGKEVKTMGFTKNTNGPRTYHHYKNIKFGEAGRFKV